MAKGECERIQKESSRFDTRRLLLFRFSSQQQLSAGAESVILYLLISLTFGTAESSSRAARQTTARRTELETKDLGAVRLLFAAQN